MSGGYNLSGKTAAVTGGARGIGRDIALALAAAGAKVAIGDLNLDEVRATAKALGGTVIGLKLDVTSPASYAAFLATARSELGDIDILVNNAGIMWVGKFDDEPDAVAGAQIAVNLLGVIRGVKLVAPGMAARGSGHIITIASASAVLPTPGEASYGASKHGVLGYVKSVRAELHRSGVRISVIMPAVVDTELAAGTGTGAARQLAPADVAAAVLRTLERPRFEVTVPGYIGPLNRAVNILPRPLRDVVYRQMVPNQVKQVDRAARAGYESQFGE
ncbi:SDR family oxidoreductase [Arthrobacter stackebrandtii]|nr:SDR family oxidoreductase [Arthrobacter stackebrandtii]PYG99478.1 short-chain dehydrogenase [Arthrobacter stackebrandtii]